MGQGVRAMAAAVVNTVNSVGAQKMFDELCSKIKESDVITTSDDAARYVVMADDDKAHAQSVANWQFDANVSMLKHIMMKDSTDKAIESYKMAEFNNVVCGPNGLYPQSFVHCHLGIQPLTGLSIIDDILDCVKRARSSITWGDSMDVVRSIYDANLVSLRQKWLIKMDELDYLIEIGMLPKDDDDLLTGDVAWSDKLSFKVIASMSEERKREVINGECGIDEQLKCFGVKHGRSSKPVVIVDAYPHDFRTSHVIKNINASRRRKGRINPLIMKMRDPLLHKGIKDEFMTYLKMPMGEPSAEDIEILRMMPKRTRIYRQLSYPRGDDFMPVHQGEKADIIGFVNMKGILAKRILNLNVESMLTPREEQISKMQDVDFNKWYGNYVLAEKNQGLSFKSPTGRPLVRFDGDSYLMKPMCMTIVVDVDHKTPVNKNFTHAGKLYLNFEVCFWGGASLKNCDRIKAIPAFGYSKDDKGITVFYQRRGRMVESYELPPTADRHTNFIDRRKTLVMVQLAKDYSAIPAITFGKLLSETYRSDLTGDADAVLNYGSFLNTSARSANKKMRSLFNYLKADYPPNINKWKPEYPHYPRSCSEIKSGVFTKLIGSKCIAALKLTFNDDIQRFAQIDLTGVRPMDRTLDLEQELEEVYMD